MVIHNIIKAATGFETFVSKTLFSLLKNSYLLIGVFFKSWFFVQLL